MIRWDSDFNVLSESHSPRPAKGHTTPDGIPRPCELQLYLDQRGGTAHSLTSQASSCGTGERST